MFIQVTIDSYQNVYYYNIHVQVVSISKLVTIDDLSICLSRNIILCYATIIYYPYH